MSLKVLIIDDQQGKIAKLIEFLLSIGLSRSDMEVASCGFDGRRLLQANQYDLLLLDIALPMMPENPPEPDGGILLLEEVFDRDCYIRPKYIVGVTGYDTIYNEEAHYFSDKILTLLKFDASKDDWKDKLEVFVKHIERVIKEEYAAEYETDICIISALRVPEHQAIKSLDWGWVDDEPIDDSLFVSKGSLMSSGQPFSVIAASAPRMGMVASSLLAAKLIAKFRPRFIIMPGICAGKEGECQLGDAILANPAWDWQSGKFTETDGGPQFEVDPHQLDVPAFIINRFEQLANDRVSLEAIKQAYTGSKPDSNLSMRMGPVASGSSVLASDVVVEKVRVQHRKLLGIEMETYGVYAAARAAAFPKPTAFAVKSVCDFASHHKNDQYQSYAAHVSANIIGHFLERYTAEIVGYAGPS